MWYRGAGRVVRLGTYLRDRYLSIGTLLCLPAPRDQGLNQRKSNYLPMGYLTGELQTLWYTTRDKTMHEFKSVVGFVSCVGPVAVTSGR